MHTIQTRKLTHAYDQLMRLVWSQGRKKIDQRNNEIKELKHVFIEVTTDDITYPVFGPTTKRYGDNFAEGLIDDAKAKTMGEDFDYAYGDRIRHNDTLDVSIDILNRNQETRRVVLPIFHPYDAKDGYLGCEVPCATQIYLDIEDEELNMTLMMRSNDVVGAFPGDAYGFRKLQKHIAEQTGTTVGKYMHYANSAHIIMNNDGDFVKEFVKTPVNWV